MQMGLSLTWNISATINFLTEFRLYHRGHGYTSVKLLLISILKLLKGLEAGDIELEIAFCFVEHSFSVGFPPATKSKDSRDVEKHILHIAIHQILQLIILYLHQEFAAHISEKLKSCHLFIDSYWCANSKGKNICSVKHFQSMHKMVENERKHCSNEKACDTRPIKNAVHIPRPRTIIDTEQEASYRGGNKKEVRLKSDEARSISLTSLLFRCCCMLLKLSLTQLYFHENQYSVFSIHSWAFSDALFLIFRTTEREWCFIYFFNQKKELLKLDERNILES